MDRRPVLGGWLSLSRERVPVGRDRWLELALFLGVLLIALLTPPRTAGGAPNAPGMELLDRFTGGGICVYRRVTGVECGGCGLTRGFVALAHGDLRGAVRLNPFTPVVFAWVAWRAVELLVLVLARRELQIAVASAWKWRFYGGMALGFLILAGVRALTALTAGDAA